MHASGRADSGRSERTARRKLTRSRLRSRERVETAEKERSRLAEENKLLRQECESLRQTFIRQQQQQIAFWTGPFMSMIGSAPQGAARAAGTGESVPEAPKDLACPGLPEDMGQSLQYSALSMSMELSRDVLLATSKLQAPAQAYNGLSTLLAEKIPMKDSTSDARPQESTSDASSWLPSEVRSAPTSPQLSSRPVSDAGSGMEGTSEQSTRSFLIERLPPGMHRPALAPAPGRRRRAAGVP